MKIFSVLLTFLTGLILSMGGLHYVFPKWMNPPFDREVKTTPLLLGAPGGPRYVTSELTYNEVGARGTHYEGRPWRCALVAGSTFQSRPLDEKDSFHHGLMKALPNVHIDNFALNGMSARAASWFIKTQLVPSHKYNCLLFSNWFSHDSWKEEDILRHWGRLYFPFTQIQQWPQRLWQQFKENKKWVSLLPTTYDSPAPFKIHPKYLDRKRIRRKRQRGEVRLLPVPAPDPNTSDNQLRLKEGRDLMSYVKKHFQKVVIISQPLSYSENRHPDITKCWKILIPHPSIKSAFWDDQSLAIRDRFYTSLIQKAALEKDIPFVPLDDLLIPYLTSPDYFTDRRHFTPEGMRLAVKLSAQKMKDLF